MVCMRFCVLMVIDMPGFCALQGIKLTSYAVAITLLKVEYVPSRLILTLKGDS